MPAKATRVLIISRSHPYWGGVEKWLADLCRGLRRDKHVDLELVFLQGWNWNKPNNIATAQNINGYKTVTVLSGDHAIKQAKLRHLIASSKADVVVPLLTADGLEAAVAMKAQCGHRIIYPVHEYHVGVINDLNKFHTQIDCVVPVDQLNATSIPELSALDREKVRLLFASFSVEADSSNHPAFTRINQDRLVLGVASKLDPRKGNVRLLEYFLEVAESMPVEIVWAGVSREEVLNFAKTPTQEQLLNERVTVLGALRPDQMGLFYAQIDALVCFSPVETGPLIIWDAMRYGKLVISQRYLGSRAAQFLKNAENCVLIDHESYPQFRSSLEQIIEQSELFEKITRAAFASIVRERGYQPMLRNWAQLFVELGATTEIANKFCVRLAIKTLLASFKDRLYFLFRRAYLPKGSLAEWPMHHGKFTQHDEFLINLERFEKERYS